MKITKFEHSCLLVEDNGKVVLVDPGSFAWDSGQIKLDTWPKVDEIAVTHEHGDHFHPPFIEALHKAFPDAVWVTNGSVAAMLKGMGIANVTTTDTDFIKITPVKHETLPPGMGEPPANIQVDVFGRLTHPGDSHSLTSTKEILCMPFISPWGSMTHGTEVALQLKPKQVIPIHDALWQPGVRAYFYGMLKDEAFTPQGIELVIPTEGKSFEV